MSASRSAGPLVPQSTLGIVLAALLLALLTILLAHSEAGGQPAPVDHTLFLPLRDGMPLDLWFHELIKLA